MKTITAGDQFAISLRCERTVKMPVDASSISSIYLGPETSSCLVAGASQTDSVLDEGIDNRLVAIKPAKKGDHPAMGKVWQQGRNTTHGRR